MEKAQQVVRTAAGGIWRVVKLVLALLVIALFVKGML